MRNGIGKIVFSNGDLYSGSWNDDDIHGEGKY